MHLQHRNQAPRPQNRHRFDFERKSLKKPEAPGSAGRCEKGTGRSTAPSLCPAFLSHPFCCPSLAVFNWPDTGPNLGLGGLGRVLSPPWVRTRHTGPNGGQQGSSQSVLLLGTKNRCRGLPGSGPVSLLWGLLESFRFFLVLRPEKVFLPQVICLFFGDLPAPLAGIDGAVELVPEAV